MSSLVRGDTYFVATGTYARLILNRAASGALVIIVKGATVAEHGTDVGWQDSFSVSSADGGAQAQFNFAGVAAVDIATSNWVFDGSVGAGADPTSYGFRLQQAPNCNTNPQQYFRIGASGTTTTNVVVRHVAIVSCGPSFDVAQLGFGIGCGACHVTNSTIGNSYVAGAENSWSTTNLVNVTIESNFSERQWSSSANHGETISINNCHNSDFSGCSTACTQGQCAFNNTVRNNIFKNCEGTACIAAIGPGNVLSMNAWKFYGNVFVDCQVGDGVISNGGTNFVMRNAEIYNNTIINCGGKISKQCDAGSSVCGQASGNIFRDNLLFNSSSLLVENGGGPYTRSHNTYWNGVDTPPSESNSQVVTGAVCPLVSCAIGATGNYRLVQEAGVAPGQVRIGLTLPSPFDMDPKGRTRGADGTWERGAFEFARPAPPVNLRTP